MQRHISSYMRSVVLALMIFVGLLANPLGSYAESATVFRASIGAGTHHIHDVTPLCGTTTTNVFDITVFGGPLTLRQSLLLLKQDTQWVAASVTETSATSVGGGSSTYTSTLAASGIVTSVETGSSLPYYPSVTSTETIDLNTGVYTWHRVVVIIVPQICTEVETQDRTAVLPIALTVFPGPVITALSPPVGPIGTLVTITGQQFGANQGQVTFATTTFGATSVPVVSWTNTQIVVRVPNLSAGPYNVTVTTSAGQSNAVPFQVTAADLVVTALSNPPPTVTALGVTFVESATIQNQGGTRVASSTLQYYLSPDTTQSNDDVPLNSKNIPELAADASFDALGAVTIPKDTPPGKYFLLGCTITGNAIKCRASTTQVEVLSCPIAGVDLSILSTDTEAERFEAYAHSTGGNVPPDSLTPPAVNEDLSFDVVRLQARVRQKFGIILIPQSGFRPAVYQAHFRDIRDTWVALDNAIRQNSAVEEACKKQIDDVMTEIINIHALQPFGGLRLRPGQGTKAPNQLAQGTPLISVNSQHSLKPSPAIDLGSRANLVLLAEDIDTIAQEVGLKRPCVSTGSTTGDLVHFSLIETPCQNVQTIGMSPINLLVMDPLGRRIGYDPATAVEVNEIGEGAEYSGPDTHPQVIEIDGALPGAYTVTGVGTGPGAYTIMLSRFNEEGVSLETRTTTGVASPGDAINGLSTIVPERDLPPGDLDGDGKLDCSDLAIIKAAFGKQNGQPGFEPRADVNGDGVVNIRDLSIVAQKLPAGTHCP